MLPVVLQWVRTTGLLTTLGLRCRLHTCSTACPVCTLTPATHLCGHGDTVLDRLEAGHQLGGGLAAADRGQLASLPGLLRSSDNYFIHYTRELYLPLM